MSRKLPYFLIISVLVIVDQLSKVLIARSIALLSSKTVISGFFDLTHIQNRGAIFGFFSQSGSPLLHVILMLASLAALGIVVYYFFKAAASERLTLVSLSLILSGALGNLIDRVLRDYVIDFLDFYVKGWHWPSFNVADASITIGALLLVLMLIFRRKEKCSPSS